MTTPTEDAITQAMAAVDAYTYHLSPPFRSQYEISQRVGKLIAAVRADERAKHTATAQDAARWRKIAPLLRVIHPAFLWISDVHHEDMCSHRYGDDCNCGKRQLTVELGALHESFVDALPAEEAR